jgi:hypothetical protein
MRFVEEDLIRSKSISLPQTGYLVTSRHTHAGYGIKSRLSGTGDRIDAKQAASGLHSAIRRLRDKVGYWGDKALVWAP